MIQQNLSIILACWASVVSTILAAIKISEVWRDRLRLTTSFGFSSPGCEGNEVIIENPSKAPVMISYWALLWIRRHSLREIEYGRFPPDVGYCDITIPAHGRHVLHFEGKEYFDVRSGKTGKGKIYLKLHIIGRRRPFMTLVYPKR
jgi:hypothetical protein